MPQTTSAAVLQRVADALQVPVPSLPARWESLAAQATKDAAADLTTMMAGKGYGPDLIPQMDQMAAWTERLAFVITMQRGAALTNYSQESLKELDPREMIEKMALVLINGVPTAPQLNGPGIAPVYAGQVRAAEEELRGLGRHDRRWPW